jgi:protein-disulfide isomerase
MSKQFMAVIAAIIIVFIGIFVATAHKSDSSTKKSGATLSQHVDGTSPANVTLVEYGDFQCPYCQQYEATVEQVKAEFKGQVKFQFRNFPLTSLHPNAFAGARAAEAAALQNKYWEMHDLLYQTANWQAWTTAKDPNPLFESYAKQLGLNGSTFKTDFASSKVNDIINADQAEGTKLGITGTPTFFLDGKQVQISNAVANFEKVLKAELAKKGATTGTTQPAATTPATSSDAITTDTTTQPATAQ